MTGCWSGRGTRPGAAADRRGVDARRAGQGGAGAGGAVAATAVLVAGAGWHAITSELVTNAIAISTEGARARGTEPPADVLWITVKDATLCIRVWDPDPAGTAVLVTTQSQHWPPGQALDVPVLDPEVAAACSSASGSPRAAARSASPPSGSPRTRPRTCGRPRPRWPDTCRCSGRGRPACWPAVRRPGTGRPTWKPRHSRSASRTAREAKKTRAPATRPITAMVRAFREPSHPASTPPRNPPIGMAAKLTNR